MVALAMNLNEARDLLVREFFSLTGQWFRLFPYCVLASCAGDGYASNNLQVFLMVDGLCYHYK